MTDPSQVVPNPRISAGSTVAVTWLHLGADPGVCHAKTKKERLICKNASFEISVQLTTEVISTLGAQPRAERGRCFGLALCRARLVGCSALLAGDD